MMISLTSREAAQGQSPKVEEFLKTFLPRMKQYPGVIAIYHFAVPDKDKENTIVVWESARALKSYRESDFMKEALAFEEMHGLSTTREAYPITNAW